MATPATLEVTMPSTKAVSRTHYLNYLQELNPEQAGDPISPFTMRSS
ncbi:hypothetical protein PENANT_c026G01285 [Penicillium antarcticum]|uniref:Uncharacterized protein n=1 Tax=Penicillium antarcticum TaxID=416450 RepID=A0A1V6PWZ5_9EURO|nr:hypothetical protein PENANT_c026G01285 [Penicillium antarcticum]